jgi:creatinine amidohydrolase
VRGRLQDLTWREAERELTPDAVLLLPLGAALKEHGPHLRLDNDLVLADKLADRVCGGADVVRLPALGWHRYPAFAEYPGSVTLRDDVARDLVVDVIGSLATFGPSRAYVLNTGLSTVGPLQRAADQLKHQGVTLRWLDLKSALAPVEAELGEQTRGSHADEVETSMMLYLAPERVYLDRALEDASPRRPGERFVRDRADEGTYSPTGTWGDPTKASRRKGERFVAAVVEAAVRDLAALASD